MMRYINPRFTLHYITAKENLAADTLYLSTYLCSRTTASSSSAGEISVHLSTARDLCNAADTTHSVVSVKHQLKHHLYFNSSLPDEPWLHSSPRHSFSPFFRKAFSLFLRKGRPFGDKWQRLFVSWTPFLPPNLQCQSNEGNKISNSTTFQNVLVLNV